MSVNTMYGVDFEKNECFLSFEDEKYMNIVEKLLRKKDDIEYILNKRDRKELRMTCSGTVEIIEDFLGIEFLGFER